MLRVDVDGRRRDDVTQQKQIRSEPAPTHRAEPILPSISSVYACVCVQMSTFPNIRYSLLHSCRDRFYVLLFFHKTCLYFFKFQQWP